MRLLAPIASSIFCVAGRLLDVVYVECGVPVNILTLTLTIWWCGQRCLRPPIVVTPMTRTFCFVVAAVLDVGWECKAAEEPHR